MTTMALPLSRIPPAWRWPGLAMLVYLLAVIGLYHRTGWSMVQIWERSETFTHAYVVPPIVLWLIWRQRQALALLTPRPLPWMVLPLALLAALWWVADMVVVNAAAHFAFVGLLIAGVPLLLGAAVTRQIFFPLAFSLFAVPFGEFLTPWLMQYTADFTVSALRLTGIPVYREGQQFVIPSGRWSVVEACSGIRYLMASFMVGSLFAYLNYRSPWRRLLFGLASIAVPILANWLRAYIIVMLGHLSGNKIATGVDHILYGWVFFGVVITAMFFVGARWAEAEPDVAAPAASRAAAAQAPGPWSAWVALALVAMAWPLLLGGPGNGSGRAVPQWQLPASLAAAWVRDDAGLTDWRPRFEGAVLEQHHAYRSPVGSVGVHVLYYRNQAPGRKLVSSVNILVHSEDEVWNQLSSATDVLPAGTAAPAQWASSRLVGKPADARGERRLKLRRIWWAGGHWTASSAQAKLWEAWARISGQPDDGAALILSADDSRPGEADRLLDAFIAANFDALQQQLLLARSR